jgi:hypothetical protein
VSGQPYKWEGGSVDGHRWELEIETDRFSGEEPFVVSIWLEGTESDEGDFSALAMASPGQAREMAAALMVEADHVEAANRRHLEDTEREKEARDGR